VEEGQLYMLKEEKSARTTTKAATRKILKAIFTISTDRKTEEHRLRVFENRVLRRILGPKRNEVTGEWRKLHNEEFRDLYSSPSIIRIIKSRRMR
jgi:hypothetical protein